jgi:type VI secretion system protein ImpF
MAGPRLNPTLFDKLVADLQLEGLRTDDAEEDLDAPDAVRTRLRFYTVPRIERFNENALRATVRRELNWILNTTNLASVQDLEPYPEVRTSVVNYGVPDLAGKALTRRVVQSRAREIREAIRVFEPRMDPDHLEVEPLTTVERVNAITYVIRGDITAAVQAMPVEFKTDIEVDTASVILRE